MEVDGGLFFRDRMTLLEVYYCGSEHFDFHRQQLTVGSATGRSG